MKPSSIMTCVGATLLVVLVVVMAKTNPAEPEYEEYAIEQLTEYLKANVCTKTRNIFENIIRFNCNKLIDSASPQIQHIVGRNTERFNFIVFSIYRTNLEINSWTPSYEFETVGAFDNFYTYKAEQK